MKLTVLVALLTLTSVAGTTARYQPIAWSNEVSGKNFPLFALIDADKAVRSAIASSSDLRAVLDAKRKAVAEAASTCAAVAACHVAALSWSTDDIARVRDALGALAKSGALKSVIAAMRSSGLFVRDADLDDQAFVARSWERAAAGVNNVLAVYGKGDKPRYPAIDSVAVDATTPGYGRLVDTAMGLMSEQAEKWDMFYQPSLALALRLLDINWRDEVGRHEPMHLGENAAAYKRVANVKWSEFPYTVALVPGAGLSDDMEKENHAISPMGKQIIEIAARRYFDHKVAFIIVSGGYVHPKYTRFAEAVEMKCALIPKSFQSRGGATDAIPTCVSAAP